MKPPSSSSNIKPADLRGILKYVPRFRDQIFIIAIDGSIIDDDNLPNLLLDIAVLRSLNIGVVLIHGIGRQLRSFSEQRNQPISDVHGLGLTDPRTLALGKEAAGIVTQKVMEGLTQSSLKCALSNAIRSTPVGIVKGIDQQATGKVERIDVPLLRCLMQSDIIPVISPIACDREGGSLRVNSDHLATRLATALSATKIIFLCPFQGLEIDGEIKRQIAVEDLDQILAAEPSSIGDNARSKAEHAVKAIHAGTPRVHLVDGRVYEGLLTEIFSNEGIGTLIYGNEYQQIRPAVKRDVRAIHNLTRHAVKREEILHRSLQAIERNISQYFVFEIDENLVGCFALRHYPDTQTAELGSLYVLPFHQGAGIGKKMVRFACLEAKRRGAGKILALSTQSSPFFQRVCGFEEADPSILPPERRTAYEKTGRNSRIFVRHL